MEPESQSIQIEILLRALAENPVDSEAGRRLLEAYLVLFRHALGAWPEGILAEGARADLLRCQRMLGEVRNARDLDPEGKHAGFLAEVETKLRIEIGQLKSDEGRCFF